MIVFHVFHFIAVLKRHSKAQVSFDQEIMSRGVPKIRVVTSGTLGHVQPPIEGCFPSGAVLKMFGIRV